MVGTAATGEEVSAGFLQLRFKFFKPSIDEEGAKGNECCDKNYRRAREGPPRSECGMTKSGAEKNEKDAMGPSHVFDCQGHAQSVFKRHCDPKEDEEGNAFHASDGSESADGGMEHGKMLD